MPPALLTLAQRRLRYGEYIKYSDYLSRKDIGIDLQEKPFESNLGFQKKNYGFCIKN